MSLISSDTLFHFTPTRENLIGILTDEFKPRLSLEDFAHVVHLLPPTDLLKECAIPIVSFCDIPLSQIDVHMGHYGRYGIGLKKEWGIQRRVAPVMYIHENAPGPQGIAGLITLVEQMRQSKVAESVTGTVLRPAALVYYFKPYKGVLERTGQEVRFYDEREWRYVPEAIESVPAVSREQLKDPEYCRKLDRLVSRLSPLSFDPWDVNYVIVESEAEVLEMYHEIDSIKQKYGDDDRNLLKTRIVSAERIAADF